MLRKGPDELQASSCLRALCLMDHMCPRPSCASVTSSRRSRCQEILLTNLKRLPEHRAQDGTRRKIDQTYASLSCSRLPVQILLANAGGVLGTSNAICYAMYRYNIQPCLPAPPDRANDGSRAHERVSAESESLFNVPYGKRHLDGLTTMKDGRTVYQVITHQLQLRITSVLLSSASTPFSSEQSSRKDAGAMDQA
jgi:hypothetical protein